LDRIPNLEAGLFALGRLRCAELFEEEKNPSVRRAMIDAHILIEDAKHFKNLHLHESRLLRRYDKDARELKELQAQRKKEQEEKEQAVKLKALAATAPNGFEFTIPPVTNANSQPDNGHKQTVPSHTAPIQAQIAIG
jgi:hypothetical protein